MRPWLGCALALALLPACATGGGDDDAGPGFDAGPGRDDAGRRDSGGPRLPDAGPPRVDAGPPPDAGPGSDGGLDAGPGDAGPGIDAGPSGCPADPATITINEIMVSSVSGSGDRGEWFELRNEMSCTVNLAGLEIRTGTSTHTIATGLLTAGGYFLLAQSNDAMENHGLMPDYVYGTGFAFSNGGGSLTVHNGGTEIARVAWGSTDYRRGASRQLSRGAPETEPLGDTNWCDSTAVYGSVGPTSFLGTPGMRNDPCP